MRSIKPLRGVIDVYKCLRCGDTLAVNADAQTFREPPPLECKACNNFKRSRTNVDQQSARDNLIAWLAERGYGDGYLANQIREHERTA